MVLLRCCFRRLTVLQDGTNPKPLGRGAPCDSTLETKTVAGPKASGYRVIAVGGPSDVEKKVRDEGPETPSRSMTSANWQETKGNEIKNNTVG